MTNQLLNGIPSKERNRILNHCESVELVFGSLLCETGRIYRHAYFPITGFISLVTHLDSHRPLEMGLIGSEGMLGVTLVLGVRKAPIRAVVQGAGNALRISSAHLLHELHECPDLQRSLNRYLYISMAQLSQSAACIHFHEIQPRLARWLLMTHDRAQADHFHLTHEFLADMLGVRRSGITVAAGALQEQHLIRYTRGEITILDRAGLEAAACECYCAVTDSYSKLLG
ncbi:Crp/Fnr family transcriptional regulator [Pseudomonas sp. JS3066]|uniref:Crp/Fnr family transcriptional regulator n=1 Tax=unclassified Pseudomonas TaxID=196821 RepID=UPI0012BE2831|nr:MULTISPECIES: Crp/Fnr family transcriptional regulator [unclassified Pseudomonas]MDH4652072.1 Crp/Fnr family transcriptional regulator [Pseudomonas sp. BN606]MRK22542.1 Crp/Fnr family transcriptional regulator [Pseudomonas sp. JG-B]WVK92411.1 Crp/Fnr family transcriptional regulator [Pseudomonas sp. JS3066]